MATREVMDAGGKRPERRYSARLVPTELSRRHLECHGASIQDQPFNWCGAVVTGVGFAGRLG